MESAQRELAGVLLGHVRSLGLISELAYSRAMDLIHSTDLPALFRDPVCPAEEAGGHECAPDTP